MHFLQHLKIIEVYLLNNIFNPIHFLFEAIAEFLAVQLTKYVVLESKLQLILILK